MHDCESGRYGILYVANCYDSIGKSGASPTPLYKEDLYRDLLMTLVFFCVCLFCLLSFLFLFFCYFALQVTWFVFTTWNSPTTFPPPWLNACQNIEVEISHIKDQSKKWKKKCTKISHNLHICNAKFCTKVVKIQGG